MQILSNEQIRSAAPSIFAASPWERMSARYRHVPTIEVVDMLRDHGFFPVRVMQSRCRIPGKQPFTKHLLRLRSQCFLDADRNAEVPELILTNSHDGSSAYCFHGGIFRVVCTNGLVVASADFGGISVLHKGGLDFRKHIIGATFSITEEMPRVMLSIAGWKETILDPVRQLEFAARAFELKPNANIKPSHLLVPRRYEDAAPTLWNVLNRVQENLMKGDLRGMTASGRRMRTRPVKSVTGDLNINRGLWKIADNMARGI